MATYSYSKLSTFEKCPLKFKLRYIDKIKVKIPTTVEAFMGKIVHETLEKLYMNVQSQKQITLGELIDYFNTAWDEKWEEDILINNYDAETYKAKGQKFIIDYYTKHKPFNVYVVGIETQDKLNLDDVNQYHIRIDLLTTDKNGLYEIHDYKTAKRMKSINGLSEDRQLAMYSLWVKNKFNPSRIRLVWHFLAFNKQIVLDAEEERIERIKNQTLELIKKIESTKDFKPKPSPLCNWCLYKDVCPVMKRRL